MLQLRRSFPMRLVLALSTSSPALWLVAAACLACCWGVGATLLPAQEEGEKPEAPREADKGKSKKGEKAGEKGGGKAGEKKPLSIDEQYVRDHLKEFLHANKVEWLPDGRVKMLLHFGKQLPEQEDLFNPKVSTSVNSKFRWTVRGEYGWDDGAYPYEDEDGTGDGSSGGSNGGTTTSSSTGRYTGWSTSGLRFGMDGQAVLNCVFTDDIEAEICWAQGIGYSERQQFGFVFFNEQGRGVGSNFGSQPALFRGGRLEKVEGTAESAVIDQGHRFRLVVKGGKADVSRGKKAPKSIEYPQKSFGTGRLGFVWNGGVACIVTRIEVTGRIDAKKMAAIIRKAPKK